MEKIPETLNNLLKVKEQTKTGLDINDMINILRTAIPILEELHKRNYLYVDFSFTNFGIKNYIFYMFDFGAVVEINSQYNGQFLIHTEAFSSINTSKIKSYQLMMILNRLDCRVLGKDYLKVI